MPNPPKQPFARQNIKNLISNFGAIYVGIMHAKFQASSFTSVGGEWGDGDTGVTSCLILIQNF